MTELTTTTADLQMHLAELEQRLARRAHELTALHDIALEINSQPNLAALLKIIVERAAELLGLHAGGLYLMQPDGETLRLAVTHNLTPDYAGATLRLGEGLSGRVAQSDETLMVDDYRHWAHRAAIYEGSPFRRVIAVPMKLQGAVVGVITLIDDEQVGTFDADEVRLVELLADQAALAVSNARWYEAAQRDLAERTRAEKVQTCIYRISEATHTTPNLDALYQALHAIIADLMSTRNFFIALYDPHDNLIALPYFAGDQAELKPPHPPGRSLTAYVLRTGQPLLATPTVLAKLVASGEVELIGVPPVDWLGVPLRTRTATLGVLVVQTYTADVRLTDEHKRVLTFVSDQVAMTIERKRAEDALRQSDGEYRALYTAAERQTLELALLDRVRNTLTRELDLASVFRTVCKAIAETFGYTLVSAYLLDGQTLKLQHQVGRQHPIAEIPLTQGVSGRVARTGQPALLEQAHADPDFLESDVSITSEVCVPLFDDGRVVGVLNIESSGGGTLSAADLRLMIALSAHVGAVISRARLYTEARDSAARLQLITNQVPAVLWSVDADLRYTSSLGLGLAALGLQPNQVVGLTVQEFFGATAADPAITAHRRALLGESVAYEQVFAGRTYQSRCEPLHDAAGHIIGVVGLALDITDRLRTEEALRQTQKMESLGVLAGGIAHDFNNLLVAILGQTSLALSKLPPDSAASANVEKAVTAANRAADLTRQLLAYSGGGQFERRPIQLNALIQENLHLFEVAISKNVQLRSQLAAALPLIDGDTSQLQQVIMNLIINASESIGDRPGIVIVTTGVQTLAAEDHQWAHYTGTPLPPGDYVRVDVTDTGSGMSADTLERIFDPFFSTKFTGRGLGLAAVLGIVRGHAGGLQVESAPGRGTTFRLLFPVSTAQPARPIAPARDREEIALSGQQILVIDDEEPVRLAVTDILEDCGLAVMTAEDGETGVALYRVRSTEIDLVLLDLSMPGLSGEETFQQLRAINPQVRVILSSGYNQMEVARRFSRAGYSGFIQKPYDDVKLIGEIKRYLGDE